MNMKNSPLKFMACICLVLAMITWLSGCGLKQKSFVPEKIESYADHTQRFYEKLKDGKKVNVLIIGDSIGCSTGASAKEYRWSDKLTGFLKDEYGSKCNLTNVSFGGNTSYAGYVSAMTLDDGIDYDAVMICYGENDSEEDFELYYEAMIRAVRGKYPLASVMAILESSQRDYTDKMQTILRLADHYNIAIADTIKPFMDDYDNLVTDGTHPNDAGYEVYTTVIEDVIDELVSMQPVYGKFDLEQVNADVSTFDTFKWYSANELVRDGNTFILNVAMDADLIGIDYSFLDGDNRCTILVDDVVFKDIEVAFNFGFTQRHIMVVNTDFRNNKISAAKTIKIVFPEDDFGKEQADEFKGIGLSGIG